MSRRASWWIPALALLPAACDSDLAHDWTGRACRASEPNEPRCLKGFVCNEQGRCVTPGMVTSSAGAGGASGSAAIEPIVDPASGGAGAGPSPDPPGGSGGGGGGGGSAGTGDPLDAGVTPDEPRDAAPDGGELDAGADAAALVDAGAELDACTPTVLFEDVDGDSYGNPNVSVLACAMSGWVGVAGDCRDDLVDVNPDGDFSGVGYANVGSPGGVSFDYDCSGNEQPDPTNTPSGAALNCSSMLFLACSGAGYATTARSGGNVSNLCGSTAVVTCTPQDLACTAVVQTGLPAFRCR